MRVNALFGSKGKAETSKTRRHQSPPRDEGVPSGDEAKQSLLRLRRDKVVQNVRGRRRHLQLTNIHIDIDVLVIAKEENYEGETVLTVLRSGGVRWYQKQKEKAYEYWRALIGSSRTEIGSWGQNAKMPRYLPHSSYVPERPSSNPYLRNKDKLSIEDLKFTQVGRMASKTQTIDRISEVLFRFNRRED